jgi:protein gp37
MGITKIAWTNKSWNPVSGCTPVSEGCRHCYARAMAMRQGGRNGYPADEPFRVTWHEDRVEDPMHWRKPAMVFVCSMGDLFHAGVTDGQRDRVFDVIRRAPQHTYQILTKRPELAAAYLSHASRARTRMVPHGWFGTSVEDASSASRRLGVLAEIPVLHRFASVEPLLGAVDLRPWLGWLQWVIIGCESRGGRYGRSLMDHQRPGNDGGETNPITHAREEWLLAAAEMVADCRAAGVPVFVKTIPGEDGRLVTSVMEFPESLRYREWPAAMMDVGFSKVNEDGGRSPPYKRRAEPAPR